MSQTSIHTSPLKDSRRILGEKSANACLSPARSPIKHATNESSSPKKLLPSPTFIAQKRPIGQVDGEDHARGLLRVQRVEARVPAAVAPDQHGSPGQTVAERDYRPTSNAMKLDEPTKQPQQQINAPFHAGNSQKEAQQTSTQTVPSDPNSRKQFIQEKANLLRNRLQNAMRHVRDPQFDRRVSELEAHCQKYPRLSESGIQHHLEQKYGAAKEEDDEDEADDQMLSTPRAQIPRPHHLQGVDKAEDGEVTPTQSTFQNQHAASPTQMLLSSPSYNPQPATARSGTSNRKLEVPQNTAEDTLPSSQRGGHESDGDAVDGLLKLMGTTPNHGAGTTGYDEREV
ncbi:hypothetical protein BJY01DRAFT_252567 [Aspergillus pseudoustus]|uniref:Uncharacterized protein n=1 Tax=Aspergillus pseudoustus TaxID=1810923 RepID=A0ABR4J6C7_9EURO